ncbi:MAG: hypothetical protein ACREXY_11200 [Gammaproteobacteria bacterium]
MPQIVHTTSAVFGSGDRPRVVVQSSVYRNGNLSNIVERRTKVRAIRDNDLITTPQHFAAVSAIRNRSLWSSRIACGSCPGHPEIAAGTIGTIGTIGTSRTSSTIGTVSARHTVSPGRSGWPHCAINTVSARHTVGTWRSNWSGWTRWSG